MRSTRSFVLASVGSLCGFLFSLTVSAAPDPNPLPCSDPVPKPGYSPSSDGCGSGWNEPLVPDDLTNAGIIVGVVIGAITDNWGALGEALYCKSKGNMDITSACNRHDQCWGTCGSSMAACNAEFLSKINDICDLNQSSTCRSECRALGWIYYAVVSINVAGFKSSQLAACTCCGDGICDESIGETSATCAKDCYCGNGVCERSEETCPSCPADCSLHAPPNPCSPFK